MKRLGPATIIIILALSCIGILTIFNIILSFPTQAANIYGPPARTHGTLSRFRYAIELLLLQDSLTRPTYPGADRQVFEIAPGQSALSVVQELASAGLINNPDAFRIYLVYSGIDTRLQTGQFSLSAGMTPIEIAQTIQNPDETEIKFVVFPGWRIEEIAAALPTSGLRITPDEFLKLAQTNPSNQLPGLNLPDQATYEGFLYPTTYTIPRNTSASDLILVMLKKFRSEVSQDILNGFARQGLTVYEAVILASIIERESIVKEESPRIASVFLNRLNIGMGLQADPTVQFAIANPQNWWKSPLSLTDLEIESPYNTYKITGLPPGPISNPGTQAIRAVAYPDQTDYLYFRAACDGSGKHLFAVDFQNHQKNACP